MYKKNSKCVYSIIPIIELAKVQSCQAECQAVVESELFHLVFFVSIGTFLICRASDLRVSFADYELLYRESLSETLN